MVTVKPGAPSQCHSSPRAYLVPPPGAPLHREPSCLQVVSAALVKCARRPIPSETPRRFLQVLWEKLFPFEKGQDSRPGTSCLPGSRVLRPPAAAGAPGAGLRPGPGRRAPPESPRARGGGAAGGAGPCLPLAAAQRPPWETSAPVCLSRLQHRAR